MRRPHAPRNDRVRFKQAVAAVLLPVLALWATPLTAATYYWDAGGGGTTTWTTLTNWNTLLNGSGVDPAAAPGASDIAWFNISSLNTAQTATLGAALSIGGLVFNSTGTVAINTNGSANRAITLGTSGLTINAGAGAVTFGTTTANQRVTFTLGGSQTWLNNSSNALTLNQYNTINLGASNTLTIDGTGNITQGTGAISGTGTSGIIKNGTGTLTFGNVANTFTGGVTLNTGKITLGNDASLGAGALTITGGQLDVTAARLTTNNNAQNWNGDFTFLGTNTWNTGTGAVTMNNSRIVTVNASTMTVGGAIGDGGGNYNLIKEGAGILALSGSNTYGGNTLINTGVLAIAGISSLPGWNVNGRYSVASGATLAMGNGVADADIMTMLGTTNFQAGSRIGFDTTAGDRNYSVALANSAQGALSLNKVGANVLTLSGANSYTGGTFISAGTLAVASDSYLGAASGAVTLSGGALRITGTGFNSWSGSRALSVTAASGIDIADSTNTFTIASSLTPGAALTKSGAGMLSLAGGLTTASDLGVTAGVLDIASTVTTGSAHTQVGSAASARGTLRVTTPVNYTTNNMYVGNDATGAGAVMISDGSVKVNGTSTSNGLRLGNGTGGYAGVFLSGGTLSTGRIEGVSSTTAGSAAVLRVSGGTLTNSEWTIMRANTNEITITGGMFNRAGSSQNLGVLYQGGAGTLGVMNLAGGTVNNTGRNVTFGQVNTSSGLGTGILNLDSGTLRTGQILTYNGASVATNAYVNFSGGTLQADVATTDFIGFSGTGGTSTLTLRTFGPFGSYAGGAVIDTNAFNVTLAQPILAPTGSGVTSVTLDGNTGSGYIGAPVVALTGGSGSGATAFADMVSDGAGGLKIGSITITNPGVGYETTAPTVTLTGGGAFTPAVTTGWTVGVTANTSGGLTKNSAGTLTLTAANTYTGATSITSGGLTLSGNGAIANTSGLTLGTAGNRVALALDNTGTNVANRVADVAPITWNGGSLTFLGNAAVTTETLGAQTLNAGALTLTSTPGAGGSILTLGSIPTRAVGGTLYVNRSVAGGGNQVLVGTAPALTNTILRWAVVNDGSATRFATHTGDGTNLAPQTAGYTAAETGWTGATINALPTADVVLTANRTAYTLTLDSGIDWNVSTTDRILTLSGAVLQTGGTSVVGTAGGTIDNILAWGANEAIFHVVNGGTLQLNRGNTNTLTGTAGLTKSGDGTLILNGVSTLTTATAGSAVNINEGTLELRGATALLPASSTTPVNLNGAMLRLSNDTATTYNAPLVVNTDTTVEISRVTAAATATTHTVGTLNMGGARTLTVNPNTTQISGGATAYGLTTGALTLNLGGAIFNVANNGTGTGTLTVGTISGAFPITKTGAGNLVTNNTSSGYTAPVTISAGNVGWSGASGAYTESQIFSGAGGIFKSGAGTVTLGGANTFTGGVTTTAGVLEFSTVGNNASTTATNLGQGTDGLNLNGGTLSFIGGVSQTTNRAAVVNADTSLAANGTGGAAMTFSGAFTAPGTNVTLTLTGTGVGYITSSSFVASSGTGDTTKTGSGTWTITGPATTGDDLLINDGTLILSGSQKTVTDDVIVNGASSVLNLNATGVINGASSTSAGLYIRAGGVVNLNADDAYNTSNGLDYILMGDTGTGGATLNTNTFNITTPRLDVGQDSIGYVGTIAGTGTVTVGTSAHLFQGTVETGATLLGAGNVYKLGGGTFTLIGSMTGMTSATGAEIHSGTLNLDYTSNTAAKLAASQNLNFSGGTLLVSGNASADTFVTVNGLNLTAGSVTGSFPTYTGGSSAVNLTPGGVQKVALSFGNISRTVGGSTLRFNLPAGTQDATNGFITTQANTNGIIGGYATVQDGSSTNFATNSGGNIVGVSPTAKDLVTTWSTAENITDSSGFSGMLATNANITSLRFDAASASTVTINPGVVLSLSSGGVLQTTNVAGNVSTITGGRLTSGAGNELIFNVDADTVTYPGQRLDVFSQISGSSLVTKGGTGVLRLDSANNFYTGATSVLGGTLQVKGGGAIGDQSTLIVGGGQTSTFELLASETLGSLAPGGENGSTAGAGVVSSIKLNDYTLTFNQETAITTAGTLFSSSAAGTLVKSGSAIWTNTASNPNFLGTFRVDQGLAIFSGNFTQLSGAAAVILNGPGSSLRMDNDQTSGVNRIKDTATITLNNTAGTTAEALGMYLRRNGGSTTATETVTQLVLGAGHNTVAVDATGASRISTLSFSDTTTPLLRNNYATLLVVGRALGDAAVTQRGNVTLGVAPAGSIGGAGAADSTTINIYPYVVGESTSGAPSGSVNFGNSLVRFVSTTVGFKPLKLDTEYVNDQTNYDALGAGVLTNNVRFTATTTTLANDTTGINAVVLDSGTGAGITVTGPAQSHAITSGVILSAATAANGASANEINGFTGLTSGNPYHVYVTHPSGTLTLTSPLTSGQFLVKAGAGTLVLNSTGNAFTDLYFNQGVVQASALEQMGTAAASNFNFFGGTLKFGGAFDPSLTKSLLFGTGGGTLDTNGYNVSLGNGAGAASIGMAGAGGLTKAGAGSVTLAAQGAYAGNTAIQNGSMILASGANNRLPTTTAVILGSGASSGVLQLGNGAGASDQTVASLSHSGSGTSNAIIGGDAAVSVLTVNQITQTTFVGSIGGVGANENNLGVTKAGLGSLTLSGSSLTFTGPLAVTGGDLNITGSTGAALAPSAVTVNAGATLNLLNGTGQTIDLGVGALSLGTSGSGPAVLGLELGSTSAYDHIITAGAATTSNSVLFNLANLTGFGPGNYDLLRADSGGLSAATYSLGAAALGGVSLNLSTSNTLVQLQVNAIVGDLYWKGDYGTGWTAFGGLNSNFTTDLAGTTNAQGIPGESNGVIFSANGQTNTALNTTLNANFFIRDLKFNNNLGSGPLASISIAEGSGGSLTIAGAAGITVETGAPAAINISAPVTLGVNQTWTVAGGSTLTTSGGITGTANLTKAGTGILALSGTNSYVGTTTVSDGMLRANSANALNGSSAHTIGSSGVLRLNGFAQTIASLSGVAGSIVENGAASGNVVLTVGDVSSTTFAGAIQNGGPATVGLTKIGTGALTLSGANTYTGNTTVSAGSLNITGSVTGNNTSSSLIYGNTAGNTVVNVSGSVNAYITTGATIANSVAVLNQTAGTVTIVPPNGTDAQYVAKTGYGYLNITGGTFTTGRFDVNAPAGSSPVGVAYIGGTGTLNQNVGDYFIISYAGTAQLTVGAGGILTRQSGVTAGLYLTMNGTSSSGTLNVAGGTVDAGPNRGLAFGFSSPGTGNTGFVNVADGTLSLGANTTLTGTAGSTTEFFNFAGGTIKANATLTNVIPASTAYHAVTSTVFGAIDNSTVSGAPSFSGGLTVNSNNFTTTFSNPLLGATGYAVTQANITIPGTGNSGYIGAPAVQFSAPAGGGVPASGYALISSGQVSGIVITNPGTYALNETPTVTLTGGGGSIAPFATTALTVANTSGGVTKTGLGTLTLSGANTYTGGTNVNQGTLALGSNDVLADSGNVTISGGTFDVNTRTDSVATVSLQSGGIVGTTGVLTSSGNYDLRSGTVDFSGIGGLAGSGNVVKTTSGTVTLLNNGFGSTFSKSVNVNGGKLAYSGASQFGDASITNTVGLNGGTLSYTGVFGDALGANRSVTLGASGGTLEVTQSTGVLTLTGGISASSTGNLTKTGPGTVIIPGTSGWNSGLNAVTVSEGTLQAGFGTSGIGALTVGSGAYLNLTNSATQILTLGTSAGALMLNGGARLGFELGAGNLDPLLSLNDLLIVGTGGSAVTTSGVITLDFVNAGSLSVGNFNLLSDPNGIGGLLGTGVSYVLGSAPSGFNYVINATDNLVSLNVSQVIPTYWTNSQADGSWATINPGPLSNWSTDAAGLNNTSTVPGTTDTVVFSASNVAGPSITTTLDGNYTIDGLQFVHATTPATTTVTINQGTSGTLTLAPVSTTGGIFVDANAGDVTINAPVVVSTPQTWNVDGTGFSSLSVAGDTTFTASLNKTGLGTLTFSGTNSGAGGITLTAGTLKVGSSGALGIGSFTINTGAAIDATAPVSLSNSSYLWNGNFAFNGSNNLGLGSGAITLGGNVGILVSGSTLTVGGGINDGGFILSLSKAGSGTLVLNGNNGYDGLTTVAGGTLTLAGNNSGAGGGVTLSSGTLNINHNNALGTGAFTIGAGTTINNTSGSLVTNGGINSQTWTDSFTFTGTNSLDLGTGAVTLASNATVTTAGAATSLTVGGGIDDGASSYNLTKNGPGTLILGGLSSSAANNYSGTTILDGGTLAIASNASLAGSLNIGSAGGTTLSTLDLNAGSLTVGGGATVQTNSSSANTIQIGSGRTLRLNGSVMIGTPGDTVTKLDVTGLGTLTIGSSGEPTNSNVSLGGNTTSNVSNGVTWDLSGLSTFYANLGSGTLRIGDASNSNGTATKGSTLILADDSTILAATITQDSPDSGVTQTLKLGSGSNLLAANTINIGSSSAGRSNGNLSFNEATGSLTIRSLADPVNGRATLNLANMSNSTTASTTGTFDVTGHSANLRLGAVTVASRTAANTGSATGIFSFDSGTLDMNDLLVGNKAAATTGGNATGTVNLGGTGITTINNATGPVQLGVNGAANNTASGTLNVTGGTVNIASFSGNSIRLGQATAAGGTATGLVDVSGGTLNVAGNIIRGATAGTSSATVTLSGGTLNMAGNSIGTAVNPVTFNAQSGTLQNLAELNGGASTLTKTMAGVLTLTGTNAFSGGTAVSAGTLRLGASNVIPDGTGKGNMSVTGTLDLNGYNETVNGLSGSGTVDNAIASATSTLTVGNNNASSSFTGVIQNSGTGSTLNIVKTGSGVLTLGGAAPSTYTGTTVVNAGALSIAAEDNIGANPGSFNAGQLTLNGGILQTTSTFTIDDSNRGATLGASGGTFETAVSTTLTVKNAITGSGTLSKTGDGVLLLDATNDYSGTTYVNQGTLGGTGTIGGAVTAQGGTLTAGTDTATGKLTVGGAITATAPSTWLVNLVLTSGGQTNGTGTIVDFIAGQTINPENFALSVNDSVDSGWTYNWGEKYKFASYTGYDSSKTFSGGTWEGGHHYVLGTNAKFEILYDDNGGFSLMAVPEPETWVPAVLVLALGAFLCTNRRRRRMVES